jgi:CHAT domain-containing protein
MARFYRAMLAGGRPPAAALREAQMSIRAERRWREPAYWAPFVLQGDWR